MFEIPVQLSNGTVYWVVSSSTVSACAINTKFFPFDKHRCSLIISPEMATNFAIYKLFDLAVVSAYSKPNSNWKLGKLASAVFPQEPYKYTLEVDSINLVNESAGLYVGYESGIVWEFDYERTSGILVMGWLMPLILMITMSNLVYLIPPNTADRLGFLTTMGLSIMILISMISDELPNAPTPKLEPLVNKLYETGLAAFVIQLIVVVITDHAEESTRCPPFRRFVIGPVLLHGVAKEKTTTKNPTMDALIWKLEEIRSTLTTILDSDASKVKSQHNLFWRHLAKRINVVCFLVSMITEIYFIGDYFRQVQEDSEPLKSFL